MIEIKVPNVPSKQELFDQLKADFAGIYKVYFFGFNFRKISMVRKSFLVAVMVTPNPRNNTIVVTGTLPTALIFGFFSGLLPMLLAIGTLKDKWELFETEMAERLIKKYDGEVVNIRSTNRY